MGRFNAAAARLAGPFAVSTLAGAVILIYGLSTGQIKPASQTVGEKLKLRTGEIPTPAQVASLLKKSDDEK